MSRIIISNILNSSRCLMCNLSFVRCKSGASTGNVKMARVMKKMIDKHSDKRKNRQSFQWIPTNSVESINNVGKKGISEGQRRRAHNVGRVLYKYLTELVNSGEVSPFFVDNAVDITRVRVVSDLSSINVYWTATGTEKDDEIEKMLVRHQSRLRYLLTSYHVLTHVPAIVFVKDKRMNNSLIVEELLKSVDFGPDFEPSEISHPLSLENKESNSLSARFNQLNFDYLKKDDFIDNSSVSRDERRYTDDMQMIEDNYHLESDIALGCIIRNDLYGINHEDMMKSLIIKKSKTKHRSSKKEEVKAPSKQYKLMAGTANPHQQVPNYKKLALTLRKVKAVKAKHLLQKYEQEHWREMCETEYLRQEQEQEQYLDGNEEDFHDNTGK